MDQNEDVPIRYRTHMNHDIPHQLSLFNYLKSNISHDELKDISGKRKSDEKDLVKDDQPYYDFDSVLDYYDSRNEYDFVGFIDKEVSRRKNKSADEMNDVFKLREKRAKILEKKRATGIPSLKGAVCFTSKSKGYLKKVMDKLGVPVPDNKAFTREDVCAKIEKKMLELEKYSTDKDKNKLTYIMIPANHPLYKFPYNLEDRVKYVIDKIKKEANFKLDISTKSKPKTSGDEKGKPSYFIYVKHDSKFSSDFISFLEKHDAKKSDSEWIISVE